MFDKQALFNEMLAKMKEALSKDDSEGPPEEALQIAAQALTDLHVIAGSLERIATALEKRGA